MIYTLKTKHDSDQFPIHSLYRRKGDGWYKIGWVDYRTPSSPAAHMSVYWLPQPPSANKPSLPSTLKQWTNRQTHHQVCDGRLQPLYIKTSREYEQVGTTCGSCHLAFLSPSLQAVRLSSPTHPIVVGIPIVTHYPGELYGGPLPFHEFHLSQLRKYGIKAIFSTIPIAEEDRALFSGFDHLIIPIPDLKSPTPEQVNQFLDFFREHRDRHEPVYVHCREGCGRTGVFIAMVELFVYKATSGDDAIQRMRQRDPCSADNLEQEEFIREMAHWTRSGYSSPKLDPKS